MNLLRVLRVAGEIAGDTVVEAHTEGEKEVGLLDSVVYPRLTVHAHHAKGKRVRGREAAQAQQPAGHGNVHALREGDYFCLCTGLINTVAGEDDGLLRVLDELNRLQNGAGLGAKHWVRARRRRG